MSYCLHLSPADQFRQRQSTLHNAILRDLHPVYRIKKLESHHAAFGISRSYVITLRKDPARSMKERVTAFHDCLRRHMATCEVLLCLNQCYTIEGPSYSLTYVLEGYGKAPNQIGYTQDGHPCVALLRRMGGDVALRYLKNCSDIEYEDLRVRMHFIEMRRAYPNPSARMAASARITRWQREQWFDFRYSDIGTFGSDIFFHLEMPHHPDSSLSALKIDEDAAMFLLSFIADIYPLIWRNYYEDNLFTPLQLQQMLHRIRWGRELILYHTFSDHLKPYIKYFNPYCLHNFTYVKGQWTDVEILYSYRHEVVKLFDAFLRWAEAQLDLCAGQRGAVFHIEGP